MGSDKVPGWGAIDLYSSANDRTDDNFWYLSGISMSLVKRREYQFEEFQLKVESRALERDGVRVAVGAKAFELLTHLVVHAGQVVSKEELLKAGWPDSYVDERNLTQQILLLRRALADKSDYIATIPGRGYQFTAAVREIPVAAQAEEDLLPVRRTHVLIEESVRPGTAVNASLSGTRVLVYGLIAATLVGMGGWGGLEWSQRRVRGDHHEIVLADFANATGDTAFDGTLNAALAIDLEESPYLQIAGEAKVRSTLKLMERSPDERVAGSVARELCQRINDQAVVSGAVARFGARYLITLTATDCRSGNHIVQARAEATDRSGVLGAVDSTAAEMRQRLGEPLKTLQHFNTPLRDKMTSSLEALQFYSQAETLMNQEKYKEAIPFFQRSIDLDPNFAAAYVYLGWSYRRLAEYDVGLPYYEKAYELRGHASEHDRMFIEAQQAVATSGHNHGDVLLRSYAAWADMYPNDIQPLLLLSNGWMVMARADLAIEPARKAIALDPQNGVALELLATALMQSGQLEAAKTAYDSAVTGHVDGAPIHQVRVDIAFLERDWPEIDRQLAWAKGTSAEPDMMLAMAAIDFEQGKARAGRELLEQVADGYRKQGLEETAVRNLFALPRELAEFGKMEEARQVLRSLAPGHYYYSEDIDMALAAVGEVAEAEANAAKLATGSPDDPTRVGLARAAVDMARDKPEQAIDDLRPAIRFDLWDPELMLLRGNAYLAAKQPAAAAEQYQKLIDHAFVDPMWVNVALADLGLARARAMQGDRAGAQRAYETCLTVWKDADPDLPVFKAAKAEFAKLGP